MEIGQKLSNFSRLQPEQMLAIGQSALPAAVTAVLIALAAWQLAGLAWIFVPYSAPDTSQVKALGGPAPQAGNGKVSEADMSRVAEAHLFGIASEDAPAPAAVQTVDAPDTTLSLELLGTIASDIPRESYALIHERGKETKVYAIGEVVTAGAKLHSVFADRVLLDRKGKLEALRLPRDIAASTAGPAVARRTQTAPAATLSDPSLASVITQNASDLTNIIRPQPVFADGQQRGYRLYPGRDRRKFAMLGLRPGDLITELNGTALTDPGKGMEIFQSLGDSTSVTVTVERNGQPEVLVLDTAQLTQLEEE